MTAPTAGSGMKWVGRSMRRLEDPALVVGRGRFTADLPAAHYVRFVRSPVASGRIEGTNGPRSDDGWTLGAGAGKSFGNGWRADGQVLYLDNSGKSGAGDTKVTAGLANVYYDFFPDAQWRPFVGAGIGIAQVKEDNGSVFAPHGDPAHPAQIVHGCGRQQCRCFGAWRVQLLWSLHASILRQPGRLGRRRQPGCKWRNESSCRCLQFGHKGSISAIRQSLFFHKIRVEPHPDYSLGTGCRTEAQGSAHVYTDEGDCMSLNKQWTRRYRWIAPARA